MSTQTQTRQPSAVDAIAEAHFAAAVALSPMEATYLGVPGHDTELDDLSPAGYEAHAALARQTLAALDGVEPVDAIDEVTIAAMRERLGLQLEIAATGWDRATLNNLASPVQGCRDIFDLMPTDTVEQWETIATRLTQVPRALEQLLETLTLAADEGLVSSRRGVQACIDQCGEFTAPDGYFATFLAGAGTAEGKLPEPTRARLQAAVEGAATAYRALGEGLRERILPHAPEADAVGRERYALASRSFLGASVDLEETYAWGQEELARITADMEATAQRIRPGASVAEAIAVLKADPSYQLHGTDELKAWMQERADEAIAMLHPEHFDIPEPAHRIECLIAPTQTGGIYYTGPSDDFSRPGRMWWSVPKGETEFGTWSELSTVYHEGVPGHHLQVAQAVFNREQLNSWRRMMCWTSGHGEGWALYAERLMAEFGYMDDPGNRMGMLCMQSLRAARVVLDIGVHCGFEAPAEVGGGKWSYDKAWQFLTAHAFESEGMLRFELDRYLTWAGQAPSYKIGERLWLQLREDVRGREGNAFSLRDFHARALNLGSVGLDVLREAVLRS
ncbi:MAG: DUF885 domain-containing protein [Actinobacteria bacterium]|nr:DUF885 domain-containing protein [Actinomycetota bacterium]